MAKRHWSGGTRRPPITLRFAVKYDLRQRGRAAALVLCRSGIRVLILSPAITNRTGRGSRSDGEPRSAAVG